MTQKLQDDPQALGQVKKEMRSLQDAGFIVKLSDLPIEEQERLNADFKHYIPTTIAFKETSASTKCRICWDSSRSSRETCSLNSLLLKGTSDYSVVKMLARFRENLIAVSADIRKFYNTLKLWRIRIRSKTEEGISDVFSRSRLYTFPSSSIHRDEDSSWVFSDDLLLMILVK